MTLDSTLKTVATPRASTAVPTNTLPIVFRPSSAVEGAADEGRVGLKMGNANAVIRMANSDRSRSSDEEDVAELGLGDDIFTPCELWRRASLDSSGGTGYNCALLRNLSTSC